MTTVPLIKPSIEIDLSERTIRVFSQRRLVKEAPCAIGMKGFRTPVGRWELGNRSLTPDWKAPLWAVGSIPGHIYKFGEPGNPYTGGLVQLIGADRHTAHKTGYAIHGSPNKDSIRNRLAASHGCIRVPDEFIRWIYERCPARTPVRTKR